jgi:competence protein ComEC
MIAYFKTEVPFLRLSLFFIAGLAISISFNLFSNAIWLIAWGLTFTAIISLSMLYKRNKLYLNTYVTGFLLHILLLISGIVFCNQRKEINYSHHFSKHAAQQFTAIILEDPKLKGDVARFIVEIKGNINEYKITKTQGKLLLALRVDTTKAINFRYGDLIVIKAKYNETEPAYNPSEFNYKRYLSYQQIYHQSFINQKQVFKVGEDYGNPIKAFALKFRAQQVEKFKTYLPYKDAQSVASTLILGYRSDLSQDILNAYSKTGTMHVLSVSGMHVAIVVILLGFLLSFMDKSKKGKIAKAIIMIVLIWFYALISGLDPSVNRAAIMLTFILAAKARAQKVNIFNVIAISAFILLLINPFNITNVGFQLSFIAVAGLIYLQPKIYNLYDPQNKIIKIIWSCISVSIAAQIATTPISLYYFHQFPLYFIVSNLFITLPAALIMYVGIAFLFCGWFLPLMKFLGLLLNDLITFTNNGLLAIEEYKFASIAQIWMSSLEIVLFYLILTLFLVSFKKPKYLKFALLFSGIFVINMAFNHYQHGQQKQVMFFSLRKNTAVALIKGKNATLITDLDVNEFTYLFSVKPYLDSCKINYIQYVNPHLSKDEKIFNFEGYRLKIINHQNNQFIDSKGDWLLLSGDKIYNTAKVLEANDFKRILIDGKNRDFVIKGLQAQLIPKKVKTDVLKRAYAIEIKLN